MKSEMMKKWIIICACLLLSWSVLGTNYCFAEEWKRVGERCVRNCDDQPTRSNYTRSSTSQKRVTVREQITHGRVITNSGEREKVRGRVVPTIDEKGNPTTVYVPPGYRGKYYSGISREGKPAMPVKNPLYDSSDAEDERPRSDWQVPKRGERPAEGNWQLPAFKGEKVSNDGWQLPFGGRRR